MRKENAASGGTAERPLRSEDAVLALLNRFFPNAHPSLRLGRGDDCAELALPPLVAFSSDLFLEDAHFRRSYFSLEEIGHKALAVNLSDLAAAGAAPLGFSLCLILPSSFGESEAERLFQGMSGLACEHGLVLSGGDLSGSPDGRLGFAISIWGAATEGVFLRRGEARAGDVIFLAQNPLEGGFLRLGLARRGLLALEGGLPRELFPLSCAAHLAPLPLLEQGQALARFSARAQAAGLIVRPLGLMDLSDGLARDLPRLLNGNRPEGAEFGAELDIGPGLLHPELFISQEPECPHAQCAGQFPTPRFEAPAPAPSSPELSSPALASALLGGEDYLLIGTCPPEGWGELENSVPGLFRLGAVSTRPGLLCNGKSFAECGAGRGFDHFSA